MIEVFGDIGLRLDGRVQPLGSRSQRLVLAVLAAHANGVVSSATLIDALWSDDPPATARRTLGSYVSRLRSALGELIEITPAGYRLAATVESLDSLRFEELLREAEVARPAAAEATLQQALAVASGPAFGEFADLEAVRGAAVRLDSLATEARERRVTALADLGRHGDAAALARELVAEHPLRETGWVAIIDAQIRSSPGEALRTFRQASDVLADVGLVPSAALRDAEARALDAETTGSDADRRRARPSRRSSLVGRDADIAELQALARRHRLVTLVGPGGVGKSRLAEEVAAMVGGDHRLGAQIVLLGDLTEPEAVAPAILEALGFGGITAEPLDDLASVGDLDVLLVVDNCEHVVGAAAAAVAAILDGGDAAIVVATSRQALGVDGERRWLTAPLGERQDGATGMRPDVDLFVDRALGLGVDVRADLETVARIVRRLDGLPLAIEMAASMLTSHGLHDLDELTRTEPSVLRAPTRGAPDRQRTLGNLVGWSLDQLDPTTRDALDRLSVFDGVFDRHGAAAVVSDDTTGLLHDLVDRSLIAVETGSGAARYRMLWTIRDQVRRRAADGAMADAARRHARHHGERLVEADAALRSARESAADAEISALYRELRTAHLWATSHDHELAGDISTHLHMWAMSRQVPDPFRWADRLVDDAHATRGGVMAARSQALFYAGRLDESVAVAEAALERATGVDRLLLLESLGDIELAQGRLDRVVELGAQLADAAADRGDDHYLVMGRCAESLGHAYGGRAAVGLDLLAATPAPSPSGRGWLAYTTGELIASDRPDDAAELFSTAVSEADSANNRFLGGVARVSLGALRARHGDPAASVRDLTGTIEHWHGRGMHAYLLTSLRNLIVLFDRLDQPELVARLSGLIDHHAQLASFGAEHDELGSIVERTRTRLTETRYRSIHTEAGRSTLDELLPEIVAQARALIS